MVLLSLIASVVIGLVIRKLVRSILIKNPAPQGVGETCPSFSFLGTWKVDQYDYTAQVSEASRQFVAKWAQDKSAMEVTFLPEGIYHIGLEWVIIDGPWKQIHATKLVLTDRDNGDNFFVEASSINSNRAVFRFTQGDVNGHILHVLKT